MGNKIERKCPVCGKTYTADVTRLKFGRQTTCSRECSYILRSDKLRNSADFTCATCGKEFSRSPPKIKSKFKFCSRECHYIGRSLGLSKRVVTKPYVYTSSGSTSLSRAGAYAYAAGKTLPFPGMELSVAKHLSDKRISFIHQHVFEWTDGAFVVDFYFPEINSVVEIDTITLHSKTAKADAKRDKFLVDNGISVVRVIDNGSVSDVCRAVLKFISNSTHSKSLPED